MERRAVSGRRRMASLPIITGRNVLGLLLVAALLLSCTGLPVRGQRPQGVYHRVKSGETLSAIAKAYQVRLQDLAEINNISRPDQIEADSVIFIPDASQVVDDIITAVKSQAPRVQMPIDGATEKEAGPEAAPPAPRKEPPKKEAATGPEMRRERAAADMKAKDRTLPSPKKERDTVTQAVPGRTDSAQPAERKDQKKADGEKADEIQFDKERFIWPVKGKVVSGFGIQPNKMNFNGVRIAAAEEAAVQAAAGGTVIFSAPLKDYGETIIIRHEDNFATVYTHLGTRTVRGDARVNKGDRIAFLGKGGANDEPYLYFEIRHKNKARNPLFFLP